MASDIPGSLDFTRRDPPDPGLGQRELLVQWLEYQRHEFVRKLRDLTPAQLVEWSVPPVQLSVLGLVRHMTQMEHIHLSWGRRGGIREPCYGDDDYAGGTVEAIIDEDLGWYFDEVSKADAAIAERHHSTRPERGTAGHSARR